MHPFDTDFAGAAIRLGLTLIALLGAWHFILRPTFVEEFRQRVFAIRRELFLLMAAERIRASHPAYTTLRSTLNGMLRFADGITIGRLISAMLFGRGIRRKFQEKVARAMEKVDDASVRDELDKMYIRMGVQIIMLLVKTTPFLWLLVPAVCILVVLAVLVGTGIREVVEVLYRLARKPSIVGIEAEAAELANDEAAGALLRAA